MPIVYKAKINTAPKIIPVRKRQDIFSLRLVENKKAPILTFVRTGASYD